MNIGYKDFFLEIRTFRKQNAELRERIRDLEEELKLNSKNSSMPPSSDQKDADEIPKKRGGRAKPGDPGNWHPLFSREEVDAFVELKAMQCPSCRGAVRPSGEPASIHQQNAKSLDNLNFGFKRLIRNWIK